MPVINNITQHSMAFTHIYMGDYETESRGPGMYSRFHYLDGGVILVAYSNDGYDGHSQLRPYYAFTDNLGSYTRIYDKNGNEVFHAEYDPWGKQTVTTFFRGYTEHEMISDWNLINMNGRLYDPSHLHLLK